MRLTRPSRYEPDLGEFVLPYAAVRTSHAPDYAILTFFQRAYDAAADLGAWPRDQLERRAS